MWKLLIGWEKCFITQVNDSNVEFSIYRPIDVV